MNVEHVSLRDIVGGKIADILKDEDNLSAGTHDGIVALIDALALYQEEGRELFPKVFIITDKIRFFSLLPESNEKEIGKGNNDVRSYLKALKSCAPLAVSEWGIYISTEVDKISYGIFRTRETIIAISAEKTFFNADNKECSIIELYQIAKKVVGIKSTKGKDLVIHFGSKRIELLDQFDNIEKFMVILTSKCSEDIREQCKSVYEQLLIDLSKNGHGSLAFVIDKDSIEKFKEEFRDGIFLESIVNIPEILQHVLKQKTMNTYCRLYDHLQIVKGMLQSDGITTFTNDGKIIAYRHFVPIENPTQNESGGARTRAFETLKRNIKDKKGVAAFFLSQDGKSLFERENNGN